ncbi:hypothetical protein, partial [Paenibacillus koleovorans]|uniref:hypothetical protein n=1 Tax=Paenibacillus koleovorans TaxID=121608 RepID=UPI0013E3AF37
MSSYFFHVFSIVFTVSIPITFAASYLSLAFWGFSTENVLKRIILFSISHSIVLDLLYFALPPFMRPFNFLVLSFLFILVMFSWLTVKRRLLLTLTFIILSFVIELIVGLALTFIVPRKELFDIPIVLAAGFWPACSVIYFFSLKMAQPQNQFLIISATSGGGY